MIVKKVIHIMKLKLSSNFFQNFTKVNIVLLLYAVTLYGNESFKTKFCDMSGYEILDFKIKGTTDSIGNIILPANCGNAKIKIGVIRNGDKNFNYRVCFTNDKTYKRKGKSVSDGFIEFRISPELGKKNSLVVKKIKTSDERQVFHQDDGFRLVPFINTPECELQFYGLRAGSNLMAKYPPEKNVSAELPKNEIIKPSKENM